MNARHSHFANPGRMHGLSLIELMISLTLGMMVILALGYAYLGTRSTFKQQDALGRMQEGARYAFELMSNDLRMSGYAGSLCGLASTQVSNTLADPAKWYYDLFNKPLIGYEDAASSAPDVSGDVVRGDALAVLRADNSKEHVVTTDTAAAGAFTFDDGAALAAGDIAVAAGCGNAKPRAVFEGAANTTGFTVGLKSVVMPMSGSLYYIKLNSADPAQPSLYRRKADGTSEELVEGVEDMQIAYGVDTSNPVAPAVCSDNDGSVDSYVAADQVEATVPCATSAEDWKKVLSVKVKLVMRTTEDGIATESRTYTYNDGTDVTDRRLRKEFTTTIAVRNRLQP
jgi:type IV pilus assembly protein PilW